MLLFFLQVQVEQHATRGESADKGVCHAAFIQGRCEHSHACFD